MLERCAPSAQPVLEREPRLRQRAASHAVSCLLASEPSWRPGGVPQCRQTMLAACALMRPAHAPWCRCCPDMQRASGSAARRMPRGAAAQVDQRPVPLDAAPGVHGRRGRALQHALLLRPRIPCGGAPPLAGRRTGRCLRLVSDLGGAQRRVHVQAMPVFARAASAGRLWGQRCTGASVPVSPAPSSRGGHAHCRGVHACGQRLGAVAAVRCLPCLLRLAAARRRCLQARAAPAAVHTRALTCPKDARALRRAANSIRRGCAGLSDAAASMHQLLRLRARARAARGVPADLLLAGPAAAVAADDQRRVPAVALRGHARRLRQRRQGRQCNVRRGPAGS